tara:strand:+ start:17087 stop:17593 length:507 start_codon:yes stop_codon:yes gene_type:complete
MKIINLLTLLFVEFLSVKFCNAQHSGIVEYRLITNLSFNYQTTAVLKIHKKQSHYLVLKSNSLPNELTITSESNNINILAPESKHRPAIYMDFNSKNLFSFVPMFQKNNILYEKEAIPLKEFVTETIPIKFKELESLINSKTDRHTTFSLSLPNRYHQEEIIYEWEEN